MENTVKVFTKYELENGNDERIDDFFEKNEQMYAYACSHVEELDIATVEFLGNNSFSNSALYEANQLMEKNAPVEWFELLLANQTEPGTAEKIVDAFNMGIDAYKMGKYIEMANSDFELGKFIKEQPELKEEVEETVEEEIEEEEAVTEEEETTVVETEELVKEEISSVSAVTSEELMEEAVDPFDIMSVIKKDTKTLVNEEFVNSSLTQALECITKAVQYQSESKNLVGNMKSHLKKQENIIKVLSEEKESILSEMENLKLELESVKSKKEYYEDKYNQLAEKIQSASLLIN